MCSCSRSAHGEQNCSESKLESIKEKTGLSRRDDNNRYVLPISRSYVDDALRRSASI